MPVVAQDALDDDDQGSTHRRDRQQMGDNSQGSNGVEGGRVEACGASAADHGGHGYRGGVCEIIILIGGAANCVEQWKCSREYISTFGTLAAFCVRCPCPVEAGGDNNVCCEPPQNPPYSS